MMVLVLKFSKPRFIMRSKATRATLRRTSFRPRVFIVLPYLLLVVFVLTWGEVDIKMRLDQFTNALLPGSLPVNPNVLNGLNVPGLHNMIQRIPPVTPTPSPYGAVFTLNWLSASGTSCFLAAVAAAILLRVKPAQFAATYVATFKQLKMSMVTIATMLGLAYVMNYSGMTSTLGLALAATGPTFPFLAPCSDGWAFLTGSDTSRPLFSNLQVVTANTLGLGQCSPHRGAPGVMSR
jgi:lactate permease